MSNRTPSDQHSKPEGSRQRSLQTLRDRTDELELIISSLTTYALFSLPSWLFETYADSYTHLSVALLVGSRLTMTITTGLCYVLASCFLLHLLVRAYWVGLIGLRTVFPDGINWQRTPGIGPLTRARYRQKLPDLAQSIARSDRIASSLFAVISLLTLAILWIGLLLVFTLAVAGQIGARFGMANRFISDAGMIIIILFTAPPLLLWLLDAVIGARLPALQRQSAFQLLIRGLNLFVSWIYPQRLILPVQLTLQSNTHPRMFILFLLFGIIAIIMIGNLKVASWENFSLSGEFIYLDEDALQQHIRSGHYETFRTRKDKLRAWPIIPAFEQSGAFVPLFLPYQPVRDNLLLEQICKQTPSSRENADCLRRLWSVRLNDTVIEMDQFRAAERGDLRMRGLFGLIPLAGVQPGLQELVVKWNPSVFGKDQPVDDRYLSLNNDYHIPFVFSPGYELEVAARASASTPAEPPDQ